MVFKLFCYLWIDNLQWNKDTTIQCPIFDLVPKLMVLIDLLMSFCTRKLPIKIVTLKVTIPLRYICNNNKNTFSFNRWRDNEKFLLFKWNDVRERKKRALRIKFTFVTQHYIQIITYKMWKYQRILSILVNLYADSCVFVFLFSSLIGWIHAKALHMCTFSGFHAIC